jgi:hypothetical protein
MSSLGGSPPSPLSAPPASPPRVPVAPIAPTVGKLELSDAQKLAIEKEIQRQVEGFNRRQQRSQSVQVEVDDGPDLAAAEEANTPRRATLLDKIKGIGHKPGLQRKQSNAPPEAAKSPKHGDKAKHKKTGSHTALDAEQLSELKEAKGVKDLASFAKDISTIGNRKLLYGKTLSRLPIVSVPHPYEKDKTVAIPEFMQVMMTYIRQKLIRKPGIFRLSGSKVEVDEFKKNFEMGQEKALPDMLCKLDPNTVTDLFKYFWREQPESLFPPNVFWDLVNAWQEQPMPNYEKIRDIRDELSESRRWIAWYLLDFLAEVSSYQQENMMTPSNIAIVFAPNIIKARPETIEIIMKTTQAVIELASFLVEDALKGLVQRNPEARKRLGIEEEQEVEASVMVQTKGADEILQHEPDVFSEDEMDRHDSEFHATMGHHSQASIGDSTGFTNSIGKDASILSPVEEVKAASPAVEANEPSAAPVGAPSSSTPVDIAQLSSTPPKSAEEVALPPSE